jgi:hypothetical protein
MDLAEIMATVAFLLIVAAVLVMWLWSGQP